MNREIVRLELLKLTYSHGRSAEEAVVRASELEKYVAEPTVSQPIPAVSTTLKLPVDPQKGKATVK